MYVSICKYIECTHTQVTIKVDGKNALFFSQRSVIETIKVFDPMGSVDLHVLKLYSLLQCLMNV